MRLLPERNHRNLTMMARTSSAIGVLSTIFVRRETDLMPRTHLAQSGMRKSATSKSVADAVRWQLVHLNLEFAGP